MAGMEDARVRLRRAKERHQALKDAIATFQREHPNNEGIGFDHDGKGNLRLFARIEERPPREWGLLIGDYLVDLRCALDYAVYALAVAHGGKPVPDFDSRLEFPIVTGEQGWTIAINQHRLHGVPPLAVAFIKTRQDFAGGGNVMPTLEELVGVNKHRFIHVAFHKLDATRLKFTANGIVPSTMEAKHIPGELEDGAELLTIHAAATQQRGQLKVEASLQTAFVIEPTDMGWIKLDDFLPKVGAYVEYIVGELEGFLTPGHEAPPPDAPVPLTPW